MKALLLLVGFVVGFVAGYAVGWALTIVNAMPH